MPYFVPGLRQSITDDYRIPVLIQIEPERLAAQFGDSPDVRGHLPMLIERGLRAALKTGNLVTGALYVDLDFLSKRAGDRENERV